MFIKTLDSLVHTGFLHIVGSLSNSGFINDNDSLPHTVLISVIDSLISSGLISLIDFNRCRYAQCHPYDYYQLMELRLCEGQASFEPVAAGDPGNGQQLILVGGVSGTPEGGLETSHVEHLS